jgi:ABC-2 type transport system permease protein
MTRILIRKLLRDIRVPLLVVCLLLAAFGCLWVKVTERITGELIPAFTMHLPLEFIKRIIFQGPGQTLETLMGGESINIDRAADMLSVGYVHPLVLTIFCIWAVGRASLALTGEIDRGTVELLLSQPVTRLQLVFAHFIVDLCTLPVLCLSLWAGTWLGTGVFGLLKIGAPINSQDLYVDPRLFGPGLVNMAAFLFAISGYTMALSAAGRFRTRVMGVAILATLLQFVINVIGQIWDGLALLRPFTVFYYYQPQRIILKREWTVDLSECWKTNYHGPPVNVIEVLLVVGLIGYGMAVWTFSRRDIPAPL